MTIIVLVHVLTVGETDVGWWASPVLEAAPDQLTSFRLGFAPGKPKPEHLDLGVEIDATARPMGSAALTLDFEVALERRERGVAILSEHLDLRDGVPVVAADGDLAVFVRAWVCESERERRDALATAGLPVDRRHGRDVTEPDRYGARRLDQLPPRPVSLIGGSAPTRP